MAMAAADIEALIRSALPDAVVEVEPLRDDGDHYAVKVISAAFRGKSRVAQHKMVYHALEGRAGTDIHALAVRTALPD